MASLTPQCDRPLPIVVGSQHVSSGTEADASRKVAGLATHRKERLKAFGTVELDLERYSSAILRPLTAACVFRDCSLRLQSAPPERRACRTLMREAAIKWRRGLAMGDL